MHTYSILKSDQNSTYYRGAEDLAKSYKTEEECRRYCQSCDCDAISDDHDVIDNPTSQGPTFSESTITLISALVAMIVIGESILTATNPLAPSTPKLCVYCLQE